MRNTNARRQPMSPATAKGKKIVNTSLTSSSPSGTSRCASQTSLNSKKTLKEHPSPALQFTSKPRRVEPRGDNVVLVHKANEDYAQYLKQRLNANKPISSRKNTMQKQTATFSHKAAKEYVMDLLSPFDAGQIISAVGKYTERRVKIPTVTSPTGVASKVYTMMSGRHPPNRAMQMSFDGFPKAEDFIKNKGKSTFEVDNKPALPVSASVGPKMDMEENKVLDTGIQYISRSTVTKLKTERTDKPECQCKCKKDPNLPCCVLAADWIKCLYRNNFELDKYKKLYYDIVNSEVGELHSSSSDILQIKRDLNRTFPTCAFYAENAPGQELLERVLTSVCKYDPKIGYVQGMNFIVGALLYHCSEEIAFWLFVALIEDHEMRDIYMPGFPGLYKHAQIIDITILENLGKIYKHFCDHNISVEMLATNWIFTLFACVIPIEEMGLFFSGFFEESWIFFYKFTVHLLRTFEEPILLADELSEMLSPIKEGKPKGSFNKFLSSIPLFNKMFETSSWVELIEGCKKEKLNERTIKDLLSRYDPDNMRFKYVFPSKNGH